MGIISKISTEESRTLLHSHFWLWSQLPLLPLNMGVMAIRTTSLEARNPYKENIQDAKSFGKRSTSQAMKKGMRRNANMSKYLSKMSKPNVNLDMKNDAKMNGFVLIIPNKKILITARTKNGNQPIKAASIFIQKTARMFPSLDTRIKGNAEQFTSKFPYKLKERLPPEFALENLNMNTLPPKSGKWISPAISF